MTELKKCPFCGGEAELRKVFDYYEVVCNECTSKTDEYELEDEAIEAWNTRPNPWHTGTPTEEGDYLLIIKAPKGVPHYFANQLNSKGKWRYVYRGNIIAWQKIEPYKEKEDGRTD